MGLFRWFEKESPVTRESVDNEPQYVFPGKSLDEGIAAIAALRSEIAIREQARQFPQHYGPENIPQLIRRFDEMIEPPASFSARESSLSAWIQCWTFTLYEILYHYREFAIPVWKEMSTNNPIAIVLLCRLASEGVDREQTMEYLRTQIPELPESVRYDVATELLQLSKKDSSVAQILEELRKVPTFEEALVEVKRFPAEEDSAKTELERPCISPKPIVSRRAVFVMISLILGIGVGVAVVGSTGVWGAVWVGLLATGISAAILLLVESKILNRM